MNKVTIVFSFLFLSLTVLWSCKNPQSLKTATVQDPVPAAAQQKAKQEIAARIDEIITGAKQLNADSALKPYANFPEFKIVNPDGSVMDFAAMRESQADAFAGLKSMDFSTTKEEFTFLAPDLVICTWIGRNAFELKSGEKMKTDPYVGSMTFKKKDNVWSIVYAHETSATPVSVK